jgi:hypothetical protein
MFSTITSPVFFELVIVVGADVAAYVPSDVTLFETLHTMHGVRPFKLVFLLGVMGEGRLRLEGALDSVVAGGLLDFLDSPPTIRNARSREHRWDRSFDSIPPSCIPLNPIIYGGRAI